MTEPAEEPLHAYSAIVRNLDAIARKIGLYVQGAAVIPPPEVDGPVVMQVTFLVGEIAAEEASEDTDLDAEFNSIIEGAAKAEEETEIEKIRRDFTDGKGIFGAE